MNNNHKDTKTALCTCKILELHVNKSKKHSSNQFSGAFFKTFSCPSPKKTLTLDKQTKLHNNSSSLKSVFDFKRLRTGSPLSLRIGHKDYRPLSKLSEKKKSFSELGTKETIPSSPFEKSLSISYSTRYQKNPSLVYNEIRKDYSYEDTYQKDKVIHDRLYAKIKTETPTRPQTSRARRFRSYQDFLPFKTAQTAWHTPKFSISSARLL
ncbi:unnamed protein product [Blepharisma stoltei]|uniref:Uncharacterized protein n=1 Tax=Blepharisma stoltei TaxID=1481888 RepID=A0AAU9JQ38_9CILI|nr:unnamed protein product [Blepharisma stoltei]